MSATGSRLDELRKYRFKNGVASPPKDEQKGESATTNGSVNVKTKTATVRKRIRVISLSDSSGDEDGVARHASKMPNNTQNSTPAKLTVAQREQRLVELKDQFTSVDTTILQSVLAANEWDVAKSVEIVKQKKTIPNSTVQNGHYTSYTSHASNSTTMSERKVNSAKLTICFQV